MRGRLAKEMVFYYQMCRFHGYALAPESRKSKTKFILIFNQKLGVHVVHKCMLYSNKYGTYKFNNVYKYTSIMFFKFKIFLLKYRSLIFKCF